MVPLLEEYSSLDPDSEEGRLLRMRIESNIGDVSTLRRIFGEGEPRATSEEPLSSTMATIDSFLSKFTPRVNAVAYVPEENKNQQDEDWRQLIKNQEYEKALEIIERRNLKNREKNIYFADQIRFLKKLIAIEKYNQTSEESAKKES